MSDAYNGCSRLHFPFSYFCYPCSARPDSSQQLLLVSHSMVHHYEPHDLHIGNLLYSSPRYISCTYSYFAVNVYHTYCTYYLCNFFWGQLRRVPCTCSLPNDFLQPLVTRHPSQLGLTMPDEFSKNIEFLTVNAPPQTSWQGELLPSLQPEKNTVLVSHGRPPW